MIEASENLLLIGTRECSDKGHVNAFRVDKDGERERKRKRKKKACESQVKQANRSGETLRIARCSRQYIELIVMNKEQATLRVSKIVKEEETVRGRGRERERQVNLHC